MSLFIINPSIVTNQGGGTSTFPPTTTTSAFTVPENMQVLIALPIDTDDYLYIDGDLIEMD